MNIRRMYRHAMVCTDNGTFWYEIENDRYSLLQWRRFAALGFGKLISIGSDKLAFQFSRDAVAWPVLQRRAWINRIVGFISGVAATAIAELIIRTIIGK